MYRIVVFAAFIGLTASSLQAQGQASNQSRGQSQGRGRVAVPPGQWPSAGRCRIWIDGLPAGLQPRETDCATARRTVPSNGRVLDGNARPSGNRDDRFGRGERNGRDDDDRDDRDGDDDDRARTDKDKDRDKDRDKDGDRTTRRFIDRNGLECEEKAVMTNGKRSYDLKCREPKRGTRGNDSWPPVRAQDAGRYCVDANRDARCDSGSARGYPTTLPEMIGAIVYGQGQRTSEVSQWLGAGRYQVRYTDQNRDRKPERVRWLDSAGALLQEWTDSNRDGRADVVKVYSEGRLVQSIGGR